MKTVLYFASLLLLQAYDVIIVDEFVNCVTEQSAFSLVEYFRSHLVLDANWGIMSGQTVRTMGRQINVHPGSIHLVQLFVSLVSPLGPTDSIYNLFL